jgi:transcriptional regulator with XRE-family HTH domain
MLPVPLDPADADRVARSRQIREAAGIGLRAMARQADLSRGYVSQLERGMFRPGYAARRWVAILAVLDADSGQRGLPGQPGRLVAVKLAERRADDLGRHHELDRDHGGGAASAAVPAAGPRAAAGGVVWNEPTSPRRASPGTAGG